MEDGAAGCKQQVKGQVLYRDVCYQLYAKLPPTYHLIFKTSHLKLLT